MFKNLGPHSISIWAGLTLAIFSGLWYVVATVVLQTPFVIWLFAVIILTTCIFAYGLVRVIMERYIYRRIKLIYKTIRSSKLSTQQKRIDLAQDSDVLDEVEAEVSDWADNQRRELDTIKTLEQYRRKYLGDISHELKTPIFSIQGFVHTLLDGALHDEAVNMKYLERAASNIERLLNIVYDLETITKMESGELVLEIQKFDIKELVTEVFEDLSMKAREQGIELMFKEGADKAYMVKGDRELVRQVFSNLIINSIKYGKTEGITKASFYDMDSQVLIEISDNGIGISEKHLKHLFDRFYRADKSRSRERGGSGLGLSIVKHILEAHDQTINVRSTSDVGSTFGFTLDKA